MFTDSHTHLNNSAFDTDKEDVIGAAFLAGVTRMVEIACSPAEWRNAIDLAKKYPGRIFCACGLHPHDCTEYGPEQENILKKLFAEENIKALGEIGLDYAKKYHPAEIQKETFLKMLKLTREIKKPLVIHCRNGNLPEDNAYADLIEILKNNWAASQNYHPGVFHCFSGSLEDAKQAADMGFLLGINGTITYPKNNDLRETVKTLGLKRIILETDCPYLPPQSIRGKRNDPSRIPEIAGALTTIFGKPLKEIAETTTLNCKELFGWS